MKSSLFAISVLCTALPVAAAECDVAELWDTLSVAEEAVAECNLRLGFAGADRVTAEACLSAKTSWTRHAAAFEVCLQDPTRTSALLGDHLHEFIDRGQKMNDVQRINNEIIRARLAALENDRERNAGIRRNTY